MKILGLRRFGDLRASAIEAKKDLALAEGIERRALAFRSNASQVGVSLRVLREKNHFIESVTHAVTDTA